jgi:hypothetical protein
MSDDAGAVDEVLRSAAARAVNGNTAVALARDDGSWWGGAADVLLLELAANGTSRTGGEVIERRDGRTVLGLSFGPHSKCSSTSSASATATGRWSACRSLSTALIG